MERIKVKSALPKKEDDGYPVALFERNPVHEGGELYIADNRTHEVVATSEVLGAVKDGRLERITGDEAEEEEEVIWREDDTPEKFQARYGKEQIADYAEEVGAEYKDSWTKTQIASAIETTLSGFTGEED